MSDNKNNIIYTARDIEQYLAGNLSAQQMHAMEKAALDDPFLAEAMEGYEAVKDKEWNNQLVAIREALNNKGSVAKVIPLHKSKNNWWKVAAAVMILGSGATLTYIMSRNNKEDQGKQEIAQITPATKDSITQIELPPTPSVTHTLNPSASASEADKKAIPGTIAKPDMAGNKTASNIIPDPGAPVFKPAAVPLNSGETANDERSITAAPPAVMSTETNNADVAREANAEKARTAAKQASDADILAGRQKNQVASNAKKEAVLNNFFTAQVVAADNSPLPFTNISIKKENFGTYADAKGMVRLVSTDSVLLVEVKSVGYQPKTFALHNNQAQTKIVLQEEEVALKDQTIVGSGTRKRATQNTRRAILLKDSVVNVEPADGWDNYNTYVANNLDIPESALQNNRHGEVELTFDVKANGTISNIRVNKSLGAEYDEAARRLLQDGPQWKVKKGKKTSASIKVQF
ncbi:MAG: TonB family protein [Ferruginibacter sp.]